MICQRIKAHKSIPNLSSTSVSLNIWYPHLRARCTALESTATQEPYRIMPPIVPNMNQFIGKINCRSRPVFTIVWSIMKELVQSIVKPHLNGAERKQCKNIYCRFIVIASNVPVEHLRRDKKKWLGITIKCRNAYREVDR